MLTSNDILNCIREVVSPDTPLSSVPKDLAIGKSHWFDLMDRIILCLKAKQPGISLEISRADKAYWYERPLVELAERLVAAIG